MPKTKIPIIRYLALDKCFRDTRKRYYMRDLVKACQDALYEYNGSSVEERTVRQDIKDMMQEIPYAAPIKRHMDGHEAWYRYSDCNYSIRNLPLTQDEMNLLTDVVQMLHRFSGLPKFDWMNEIIVRFEDSFQLNGNTGNAVSFAQNENLKGLNYFRKLFEAIVAKKVISVRYAKFGQDPVNREIHPYLLKQYNNRWFLIGMEPKVKAFVPIMVLPLDRIQDVEELDSIVYQEYDGLDINDYFKDVVGVSVDVKGKKERIVLKLYSSAINYILTKPIHHSQRIIETADNYYLIELKLIPNYELETIILGYANECEVISPLYLRERIRNRALKIVEMNN